jgi:TetR/AcrR family transcriptional regulator, regulator of cefoperazone and chloramphenicol sensitivity
MVSDSPSRPRPQRSDGEQSRERVLHAALALFAEQGYAKTSTREIAEAAGANLAAISYYFGDKAGLYRAAYTEPMPCAPVEQIDRFGDQTLSLKDALRGLYVSFLTPLRQGDTARLCMKLQMREMLEPTGLWQHEITHQIKPMHDAMLAVLCRHIGLKHADDDLRRLAISIAALGVHLQIAGDVIDVLAPALLGSDAAHDLWLERLTMYAMAMVDADMQRRAATPIRRTKKK